MKKKLIPLILALVCAIACAFGLAACGGKKHTEEQWQDAFANALKTPNYSLSESHVNANGDEESHMYFSTSSNSANTLYSVDESSGAEAGRYTVLLKKGDKYYESLDNAAYYKEIRPEEFTANKANYLTYTEFGSALLDEFKSHYEEFKFYTYGGEEPPYKQYAGYSAKEISFTIEGLSCTAKDVRADLVTDNGELHSFTIEHLSVAGQATEMRFEYLKAKENTNTPDNLPEVAGKTFNLYNVEVSNDDYYIYFRDIVSDNDGKTVTFNADHTLSGDIEINGGVMTTYTYTDDCGSITVSNANNAQVPAESKNTLTGGIEVNETIRDYALTLTLNVNIGGEDIVAVFTYRYVED